MGNTSRVEPGTLGIMADQGAWAAVADQGAWVAMAVQGACAAMADPGTQEASTAGALLPFKKNPWGEQRTPRPSLGLIRDLDGTLEERALEG